MNIFYLDNDPKIAASYCCDKHVIKMILESAQLLCNAHHWAYENYVHWTFTPEILYKKTHINHPCSIWVRQSIKHYSWLFSHFEGLLSEYTRRYNKVHKTQEKLNYLKYNIPPLNNCNEFDCPPQCMPDEYKNANTVLAYRQYYRYKKTVISMRWTKTTEPTWMTNND